MLLLLLSSQRACTAPPIFALSCMMPLRRRPCRQLVALARPAAWRRAASSAAQHHTELDVQHFSSIVGEGNVITEHAAMEPFKTDWMGKYKGHSTLALRPGSTQEVSQILAHCNAQRIPVVPQGGNTGLVGGGVPVHDEIVIGLKHMNKVLGEFILCYVRAIRVRAIRVGN